MCLEESEKGRTALKGGVQGRDRDSGQPSTSSPQPGRRGPQKAQRLRKANLEPITTIRAALPQESMAPEKVLSYLILLRMDPF